MSQFYATIKGNRGRTTRCGSKASGITGHIRGWDIGAVVEVNHDPKTGQDTVTVWKTHGSHNPERTTVLAEFTQ